MNTDITPETEMSLILPPPVEENTADGEADTSQDTRSQKKLLRFVITLSAIFLCSISLMLHTAAAKELFTYLTVEGRQLLLSVSIPGISIAPEDKEKDSADDGSTEYRQDTDSEAKGADTEPKYKNADLSSDVNGAADISNQTDYEPDLSGLSAAVRPVAALSDESSEPLVLIYHTHGTEAYAECADASFRSTDTSKNVVAVGDTVASVLAEAGIKSIHINDMFDMENWSAAYDTSTVAVRKVLDEHPSIQYIFDVHRDCIGNDEAGYVRSVSKYGETDTAQLMFVCGTDQGGSSHTTWQNNLTVALQLQRKLWETSSSLMRPIDLRTASFYQDTGDGALLCEFGTCANTLDEAKRSAVLFASSLADYIYGSDCDLDRDELMEKYG